MLLVIVAKLNSCGFFPTEMAQDLNAQSSNLGNYALSSRRRRMACMISPNQLHSTVSTEVEPKTVILNTIKNKIEIIEESSKYI